MPALYTVKQSPGRGLGVFANRTIEGGAVVMGEKVLFKIKKRERNLQGAAAYLFELHQAVSSLSDENRAAYFKLQPSPREPDPQVLRIFKANSFQDRDDCFILLAISRVNHSCQPNAAMEAFFKDNRGVVALRKIEKGEEVFISARDGQDSGSKEQRGQALKAVHDFECCCSVCSLQGEASELSDARRNLLNAISTMQNGYEPINLHYKGDWTELSFEEHQLFLFGSKQPLRKPLTSSQKLVNAFMQAELLEAEGVEGFMVGQAYVRAGFELIRQIQMIESVVIIPSLKYAVEWVKMGVREMKEDRGPDDDDLKHVKDGWEKVEGSSLHVQIGGAFIKDPKGMAARMGRKVEGVSKIFAIELDYPGRFLTQGECKKLLRNRNVG